VAQFISAYENKIDKKGRVSVPAAFRKALEADLNNNSATESGIFCFESLNKPCVQGGGQSYFTMLCAMIDQSFDPLVDTRDDFITSLIAGTVHLGLDADGRVTLPGDLIDIGGFEDAVAFVGMGSCFEMWQPQRFADHKAQARDRATQKRNLLPRLNSPTLVPGAGAVPGTGGAP